MESDKKRALLEKRRQLKEAQEKKDRLELIEDFLMVLKRAVIDFKVRFDSNSWNWLQKSVIMQSWGQINWDVVTNKRVFSIEESESISECFRNLCSFVNSTDEWITIVWSNELRPELDLKLDSLPLVLDELVDVDFDFWLIPDSRKWCIEYHHSGSIGAIRFD
jgi:hypothetical protein